MSSIVDEILSSAHVLIGWRHRPALGLMVSTKDPCVMCRWLAHRWGMTDV